MVLVLIVITSTWKIFIRYPLENIITFLELLLKVRFIFS